MGANARRGVAAGANARRGVVRVIVGSLMFLIGALIFILPGLTTLQSQERYDRELTRFYADVSSDADASSATGVTPTADEGTSFDAAYQFLLAYNERVVAGTAGAVNDPWGIGSDEDAFRGVGLDNARRPARKSVV